MTGETVTRARLSKAVYQEVALSRNESAELVEYVIAEISGALERGEMVKISSFGSFAVRHKGQRVGRNPRKTAAKARRTSRLGAEPIQFHLCAARFRGELLRSPFPRIAPGVRELPRPSSKPRQGRKEYQRRADPSPPRRAARGENRSSR